MILNYVTYNYIILLTLCNIVLLFYSRGIEKQKRLSMIAYILLLMLLGLADFAEPLILDPSLQYTVYVFSYAGRAFLIMLLVWTICGEGLSAKIKWLMAGLAVLNAILIFVSLETHWFFYVELTAEGSIEVHRTIYSSLSVAIPLFYLGILFWQKIRHDEKDEKGIAILAIFSFECITSCFFDLLMGKNMLFLPAICISMLVYSLYEDAQQAKQKELEQNYLLKTKQQELMLSQIQPHFLYNTLGNIRYLVHSDPDKAEESLNDLALYLRTNIHANTQDEMVPFDKEMENTRLFVKIEQLRFPENRVEYDLKDEDFMLPVLTVQPMVENAMKHGIRGVKDGYVKISTYFANESHYIVIEDNGKGFDTRSAVYHVGAQNVKERIEMICHGTVSVESEKDKGTRVIICIPENDEEL